MNAWEDLALVAEESSAHHALVLDFTIGVGGHTLSACSAFPSLTLGCRLPVRVNRALFAGNGSLSVVVSSCLFMDCTPVGSASRSRYPGGLSGSPGSDELA